MLTLHQTRVLSLSCHFQEKSSKKIVSEQTTYYLENNNLLSDYQSGFRKNRSTTESICNITDGIFESSDKSLTTLAVFIDVGKDFDYIGHQIFLDKLPNFGFPANTVSWFRHYTSTDPKEHKQMTPSLTTKLSHAVCPKEASLAQSCSSCSSTTYQKSLQSANIDYMMMIRSSTMRTKT